MSVWTRLVNAFFPARLDREIDEEMESHLEEAVAAGRDPEEARRAFGRMLRTREESHDAKVYQWLDSVRSDLDFGCRQLWKNRVAAGAAILSLALAVGACTAAFRLIDAILLRPLPVAGADRLYYLEFEFRDQKGRVNRGDSMEYPMFRRLRAAGQPEGELIAISYCGPVDLTFGDDSVIEKANRQYVSGWTFQAFGLKPALGRLLTAADDVTPGAHPYAVLSYDYWRRRFGGDPNILGRRFRLGANTLEIVGVVEKGFHGTETGLLTDIFVPTMVNAKAIDDPHWGWFRGWAQVKEGSNPERLRQRLQAASKNYKLEQLKDAGQVMERERRMESANMPLHLSPAAAGVSGLKKDYKRSLEVLALLVGLVLLIACANVANLMTAQAEARGREMALRISIGAGRWRLVQLVLVESALIAGAAMLLGGLFAWWSAPFVVGQIGSYNHPVQFDMPLDWRVLAFCAMLTALVTCLFGLAPALRASTVKPIATLRGEAPHRRRVLMNALVAAQVMFCFVVHFVAGLFLATFDRISNQPLGFDASQVLLLEVTSKGPVKVDDWEQVQQRLAVVPGVANVSISSWPLMSGNAWVSGVWVDGKERKGESPYFFSIAPGWIGLMGIPLRAGRDLRPGEQYQGAAVVNEAFAARYFPGIDPVGKTFETSDSKKLYATRIVGVVGNARYRDLREEIRPTVYVPLRTLDRENKERTLDWATYTVKTKGGNSAALTQALRLALKEVRADFLVSNAVAQQQLVDQHTIRERLLAMLSLFFAVMALVLAAVGLYGVLSYGVVQRQREIGIRMALGAKPRHVAWQVGAEVFAMLLVGALGGLVAGLASERYLETLLFAVKAQDLSMIATPLLSIFVASGLAAVPPLVHALRTDPAAVLRGD